MFVAPLKVSTRVCIPTTSLFSASLRTYACPNGPDRVLRPSFSFRGVHRGAADVGAGRRCTASRVPKVEQPGVTDTEIRVGGVVSKTNPLGVDTPRRSTV